MNSLQSIKLSLLAFVVGAILSVLVTSSFQAIRKDDEASQTWQPSSSFKKDKAYFDELDELITKYKEQRLLSRYFTLSDSDKDDANALNNANKLTPVSGVTLPGGEQLVGIVSNNGNVYALLAGDAALAEQKTKPSDIEGLLEASVGDTLASGYKITDITASSIVLQLSSEETVTIELYQ